MVYYRKKGATNNAYTLTHELLQYCLRNGAKVFDRTKITTIKYGKKNVILKTSEGFSITAGFLINATGYEVVNFIDKGIVDLDCTYALVSEAQDLKKEIWKDNIIMWNTDDPYLYACTTNDDRIIVGGRDKPFVNTRTLHSYLDKKTRLLEKDLKKYMPGIRFKKEFGWSGVFGKTKDSLPYIGSYPKTPRTFYALGFGGNGITFSLIAAEIITDLIQGKKNKDAELFSFSR